MKFSSRRRICVCMRGSLRGSVVYFIEYLWTWTVFLYRSRSRCLTFRHSANSTVCVSCDNNLQSAVWRQCLLWAMTSDIRLVYNHRCHETFVAGRRSCSQPRTCDKYTDLCAIIIHPWWHPMVVSVQLIVVWNSNGPLCSNHSVFSWVRWLTRILGMRSGYTSGS